MPKSAMKAICFSPVTVNQSMARECSARRPRPCGPSAAPTTRKPRIGLILRRCTTGATMAAVPRTIRASLKTKISLVPAIPRNIDCEGRSVHTFVGSEKESAQRIGQRQGMETT